MEAIIDHRGVVIQSISDEAARLLLPFIFRKRWRLTRLTPEQNDELCKLARRRAFLGSFQGRWSALSIGLNRERM